MPFINGFLYGIGQAGGIVFGLVLIVGGLSYAGRKVFARIMR